MPEQALYQLHLVDCGHVQAYYGMFPDIHHSIGCIFSGNYAQDDYNVGFSVIMSLSQARCTTDMNSPDTKQQRPAWWLQALCIKQPATTMIGIQGTTSMA